MNFGSTVIVGSVTKVKSALRWRGSATNNASSAQILSAFLGGRCVPNHMLCFLKLHVMPAVQMAEVIAPETFA